MKQKKGSQSENTFELKSTATAVLGGSLIMMTLLFLFALLYANYDLPLGLFSLFAIITLLIGCFLSGFICSRLICHQGMRWGGICGFTLFLCLLACALITQNQPFGNVVFSKVVMMTTAGMIGGVFGVNFRR